MSNLPSPFPSARRATMAAALALFGTAGWLAPAAAAHAELFVSVQDGKQMLVAGKTDIVPGVDMLSILELKDDRLSIVSEVPVAASVIGPPTSLALVPGAGLALVAAGFKRDPADAGQVVPDNTLSVVDLRSVPPRVIDRLHVGMGAAGVSVNAAGTLALVANHEEGSISVLAIEGRTVTVAGKLDLGAPKSGPMHVAISPDGRHALVSRDGDHKVTLLDIGADRKVTLGQRDMFPGQRPDCIDFREQGDLAVVANIGRGQGDTDTVSLIDMTVEPPRVVDTASVGQTPESAFFVPGGAYVAVNVMDGSNKPADSPFHQAGGHFVLLRLEGRRLVKVASLPIGVWSQGMAFSADGRTALVQNTGDQNMQVVQIRGESLADTGQRLAFKGALASVQRMR